MLTIGRDVFHFLSACVGLIWLGQDGDEHGDGPVVVEDPKHQPHPSQDHKTVDVAHDYHGPEQA